MAVRQFPHQCRILRYEELIANPQTVSTELQKWLDWPVSDVDEDSERKETSAPHVGTASYDQVGQSIYRSG